MVCLRSFPSSDFNTHVRRPNFDRCSIANRIIRAQEPETNCQALPIPGKRQSPDLCQHSGPYRPFPSFKARLAIMLHGIGLFWCKEDQPDPLLTAVFSGKSILSSCSSLRGYSGPSSGSTYLHQYHLELTVDAIHRPISQYKTFSLCLILSYSSPSKIVKSSYPFLIASS